MAQLAAAAMVGGTLLSAYGRHEEGQQASRAASIEATQYDQRAGTTRATSQRQAIEERRQATLAASRAQAVAASSGADATSTDVTRAISDIAGEGEYRALTALYEGEDSAVGDEYKAKTRRYEGRMARRAGNIAAMSTLLKGAGGMKSRFGASSSMGMD